MDTRIFEPVIELKHEERSALAQMTSHEGYRVFHRICRSAVDTFMIDLINAKPGDAQSILALHNLSKAAAEFYERVTGRINEEVRLYVSAPRSTDKPIDITEDALDIGALASRLVDLGRADDLEEGLGDELGTY